MWGWFGGGVANEAAGSLPPPPSDQTRAGGGEQTKWPGRWRDKKDRFLLALAFAKPKQPMPNCTKIFETLEGCLFITNANQTMTISIIPNHIKQWRLHNNATLSFDHIVML